MLSLREPTAARLAAVLAEQAAQPLSYVAVGATRSEPPEGYRHHRRSVELGRGPATFDRAAEGLRRWQAHRGSGAKVHPPDAALVEGQTVVMAVPVAFVWTTVACRIVYVVDEPTQFGFAYGTLAEHVLEGEESFLVEQDDTGRVRFAVSAFLRPRLRVLAAAGPVVHGVDWYLVGRYLRALRASVDR